MCAELFNGDSMGPFFPNVAAGLNWVRVPIGFWAVETMGDEPFLAGTSWRYFLKA